MLARSISAPRLGRYIQACTGNVKAALGLYQWNLEISAAFFLPLQILEVTIRNAVADAIEITYGPDWPHNRAFATSLKAPRKVFNPRQHLRDTADRHAVPSKVVADLKFVFWQKMFIARLDSTLWNPHLKSVFPHVDHGKTVRKLRSAFHDDLEVLRILRNRIAHHEPIFERDLHNDLALIDTLIGYRCRHTANWMRRTERVSALLARCPLAAARASPAAAARKTA